MDVLSLCQLLGIYSNGLGEFLWWHTDILQAFVDVGCVFTVLCITVTVVVEVCIFLV